MRQEPIPAPLTEAQEDVCRTVSDLVLYGAIVAGFLLVLVAEISIWKARASLLGILLMVMPLLVRVVVSRWERGGHWLTVASYSALMLLLLHWLPSEAGYALLAFPASLAALLMGPVWGIILAAAATVLVAVGGLDHAPLGGMAQYASLFSIWGAQTLAWAASRLTREGMRWSWWNYERNATLLRSAREQRVELKQAQADLLQANRELASLTDRLQALRLEAEAARRAKEEFVANVSHELRTPLNMIIGFSEIIMDAPQMYGSEVSGTLLADIAVIQRNSQHLASLVDDVLDLSRTDSGRMVISRDWVSLQEIAHEAEMAVRPLYESKQLRLVTDIPPDLPLLYMDETRMRQVLLNLVSNAGRFTDHGGVEVVARRERDEVVVSVTDTGPGISPTDQERIFEPFRQAGSSNLRRHGGTGLGLSISKRFVELHGGRMWVESELGRGATFFFALPRFAAPTEDDASVSRWFNPYQGPGHGRRSSVAQLSSALPRYVILDPSHAVARRLARYHDELEVVSVETPQQAMEQIARLPARALIVNDPTVRSQQHDIAWLNNLPLGTPAFVCHVAGEREIATRLGVTRYLIKPVGQEDLVAALEGLETPIETVLIADDNPEAVQLFSRMLTATGNRYRVLRALNGERALALLRSRRPDVMLLDLVMPGKSGYEILAEKQRDSSIRDIPAIAISAQDMDQGSLDAGVLTIVQSGGLLRGNLLDAILQISTMLAPTVPGADRAQH